MKIGNRLGPRPNLSEFLAAPNLMAVRWEPSEIPGVLRKRLEVPAHCAALAYAEDGDVAFHQSGSRFTVAGEVLLARTDPGDLTMIFPELRSADGYTVSVALSITGRIVTDRADLFRDFGRVLLPAPGVFTISDMKSFLGGEVRRLLDEYVGARNVVDLHRKNVPAEWLDQFRAALERFTFGSGVEIAPEVAMSLSSYDYETEQAKEEARRREARRREEEAAARAERMRRLEALLREEDVRSLIERVSDERLRSMLYAKLMEEDALFLSKEDLIERLGAAGEELRDLLFRALHELPDPGSGGAAGAPRASPVEWPEEHAEDVYLACGRRIVRIAASDWTLEPQIRECAEPLRSVRVVQCGDSFVAGGGKTVLYLFREGGAGDERIEFPLAPRPFSARGGINSVAASGPWLFATHSEFGLARWQVTEPGRAAERLFDEITARQRTVRGVCAAGGRVYFAAGPEVWCFAAGDPRPSPQRLAWPETAPITALAALGEAVFAGAADGTLIAWFGPAPAATGAVLARRKEPVVGVRPALLRGLPHVVFTAHDTAVHARVIGQPLETAFESGGVTLAFMDACADLIAAVDGAGGRLFLWRTTQPSEPAGVVECWRFDSKPVLDVHLSRVAVGKVVG